MRFLGQHDPSQTPERPACEKRPSFDANGNVCNVIGNLRRAGFGSEINVRERLTDVYLTEIMIPLGNTQWTSCWARTIKRAGYGLAGARSRCRAVVLCLQARSRG